MLRSVIPISCALLTLNAFAQIDIGSRVKNKVNQRVEQKIDQGIDKALDNTEEEAEKAVKGDKDAKKGKSGNDGENASSDEKSSSPEKVPTAPEKATLKTYGKFDFIPGEKVLLVDDFSNVAVGDFPMDWNTNGSAEVVQVEGKTGKWFMMPKEGVYLPEYITTLPDNFTLQFDLGCNDGFSYYSSRMFVRMLPAEQRQRVNEFEPGSRVPSAVDVSFHPRVSDTKGAVTFRNADGEGAEIISNEVNTGQFHEGLMPFAKVSIWRQGTRLRVYLNEEKVLDIPRAFQQGAKYNTVAFSNNGFGNTDDRYLLSNIRLAVGAPDTRSKLITEGKLVTRGILFDTGSDKIKPESFGTLKDIANTLTENPDVKVKIIGHTDSDGDDAANLELSKRRAQSVKDALAREFSIDASRMETDGKGESQPSDKNDTATGKANNRRVEFVKL
ncbi:MAG: OmpA family protein [Flavobacteriales bacterium]